MFEHIESLGDEFVIHLKLSCLSNENQSVYTPKDKLSKRVKQKKILDKKFNQEDNFLIDKLDIKEKLYRKVDGLVEWETLIIGDKTYTVLRISLSSKEKTLFQHPMILLTNRK